MAGLLLGVDGEGEKRGCRSDRSGQDCVLDDTGYSREA